MNRYHPAGCLLSWQGVDTAHMKNGMVASVGFSEVNTRHARVSDILRVSGTKDVFDLTKIYAMNKGVARSITFASSD